MHGNIETLVRAAIAGRVFPGIEVLVAKGSQVITHGCWGHMAEPDSAKLTTGTIFDLASLTKPISTASILAHLVNNNTVTLADPVGHFIPEFAGGPKDHVTLGHLAIHTSGLAASATLCDHADSPKSARAVLMQLPLTRVPGAQVLYSCLGYLVLGQVISEITKQPLNELFQELIAKPQGLMDTTFRPLDTGVSLAEIAPTAPPLRQGGASHGIVHDGNSRLFGGCAGNAGLFGTATDIHKFSLSLLEDFDRMFFEKFSKNCTPPRSIGWEINAPDFDECSCGAEFPDGAIGHTGFTGTSLWIDPHSKLIVIALSNRSYFSHRGNIDEMKRFRKHLHSMITQLVPVLPPA